MRIIVMALLCVVLAACGGGPVRRVSEPAASIQQLTVRTDGAWSVDLRINNFSSIPMRFDRVSLALTVGSEPAGTLQGQPAIQIGPESADVVTLSLTPTSAARIVLADALASHRSVTYMLKGSLDATPDEERLRSFDIDRSSSLTPAPGLPGVLR